MGAGKLATTWMTGWSRLDQLGERPIATPTGSAQHAPSTTADTVRVHMSSLRKKIEPDPSDPRYIVTEPWVGYRFIAEPL